MTKEEASFESAKEAEIHGDSISAYVQYLSFLSQSAATLTRQLDTATSERMSTEQVSTLITQCNECLSNVNRLYSSSIVTTPKTSSGKMRQRSRKTTQTKEHLQRVEKYRQVSQFRLKISENVLQWESSGKQDTWTKLLDEYFRYQQMEEQLLYEDQQAIKQISESTDQSVVLELEEAFFKDICSKKGHPVNLIITEFEDHFCKRNDSEPLDLVTDQKKLQIAKVVLDRAVSDINLFVEKLVVILFDKYWNGLCQRLEETDGLFVQTILDYMMTNTRVYPLLMELYYIVVNPQDDKLHQKISSLGPIRARHFLVKEEFRCGEDANSDSDPFRSAIDKFLEFDSKRVARAKAYCLIDFAREITNCVNRFSSQPTDLGADELFPLFFYLVARAKPTRLFSTIQYLNDFVDESLLIGEVGYVLITLETAANYLLETDIDTSIPPDESDKPVDPPVPRKKSRRSAIIQTEKPPQTEEEETIVRIRRGSRPPVHIVRDLAKFHENLAKKEHEEIARERRIKEAMAQRRHTVRINLVKAEIFNMASTTDPVTEAASTAEIISQNLV